MIREGRLLPLLLCVVPALLAGEKEVRVRWDELAPLVERRDVETVLTNGVYIRGRVQKVLPDALEMRVKKTSDASVIPKGVQRIPQHFAGVLDVRWKQGWARAVLTPAMFVGGAFGLAAVHIGGDEVGLKGGYALLTGFAAAGYLLGDRIDSKRMRITIAEAPVPATSAVPGKAENGPSLYAGPVITGAR